jgi:gp16 family phage-associated protein
VTLAEAVIAEVRRRITARGISRNALARGAGMPATLVHRVINGERTLSLDEADKIAAALGISLEHLLRTARTASPPDE